MVDFRARLKTKINEQKVNPIELYNSLDRAVDKGPLRQSQEHILREWFDEHRDDGDIIVKLHTGQGKTLIGLLILLSRINQGKGPALYLCPNRYLVDQTCTQAAQFGIPFCEITDDIPAEFIDGKTLLVTTVQRLFNGLSKFGIGTKSLHVESVLIDDAHSCIEAIKNACTIVFEKDSLAYQHLFALFKVDLEYQGAGTAADISSGSFDAVQCVPYWAWYERHDDVIRVLSKYKDDATVKFAWPLIRDTLYNCSCIFSGTAVEISPNLTPVHLFGSFAKARQRIFMSATFFDDSFLVKGFGLSETTINHPLVFPNEKWAGEKMVLIPSLIHESLGRSELVSLIGRLKDTKFGVVILSTSFNRTRDWEAYGCTIANKDNIFDLLSQYRRGVFAKPLVIVNRYDGIDLPDQMCRLLVLDSKPFLASLLDRYMQNCRENSVVIESKIAQTIEQGMGRAVRGEKDYCAIILIGPELIKAIHSSKSRTYFSIQTRTQIEIGLDVSEMAKDDIGVENKPTSAFSGLLNQLLKRDEGWKDYYVQKMNEMPLAQNDDKASLRILLLEKQADEFLISDKPWDSVKCLQRIIDSENIADDEKGWYLQEMGRILYPFSKSESNKMQIAAHQRNRYLLRPKEGMQIARMEKLSQKRAEGIRKWIKECSDYSDLQLHVQEILSNLIFGISSTVFERALDQLGSAIGFETQRPDKEWKEGPDNLWLIEDNGYLVFECKNEVERTRAEINKHETGQMNNSIAWFEREYGKSNAIFIHIIPSKKVAKAAGYNRDVEIIRESNLGKLRSNVSAFFREFEHQNFDDLSLEHINTILVTHKLTAKDFVRAYYTEKPLQL